MSDIIDKLVGPAAEARRYFGVYVGLVTNNKDPEGLGRVRVQFPWLSDEHESAWTRLAAPVAGKQRGVYFLPEVGDEVLVCFAAGALEEPYVLGGLWNGVDAPPVDNADGKNNVRLIRSRSGHEIRLDDTPGKERIEIVDQSGRQKVVIDSGGKEIVVDAGGGRITLRGAQIEIKPSGNLTLQAGGQVVIKGAMIDIG